jgi:hypothetical protein
VLVVVGGGDGGDDVGDDDDDDDNDDGGNGDHDGGYRWCKRFWLQEAQCITKVGLLLGTLQGVVLHLGPCSPIIRRYSAKNTLR